MGAPKGNTNALKHGLYAKHFSQEEQTRLRKMSPEDLRHEIGMMRVAVKNVFDVQVREYERVKSLMNAGQVCDVEPLAKTTNNLAAAVTALNSTLRTYALFNGKDTNVTDAFDEALDRMAIFLNGKYLNEPEVMIAETNESGAE